MQRIERVLPLILSIASGLLLSAAWYIYPVFAFLGFIPLLVLNRRYDNPGHKKPGAQFFLYCYLAFLTWNFATTWWIIKSTIVGALLAFFINSFLMCIPVVLFRQVKNITRNSKFKLKYTEFLLIPFWISFEYLHLDWDLSWTWLNVGNCFAFAHYLVQWYSITGIFGGTFWILFINILLYKILLPEEGIQEKPVLGKFVFLSVCLLLPVLISISMYVFYEEKGKPSEFVVVQPNIDSYTEKFRDTPNFIPYEKQLERLITLSEQKMTPDTRFLAWPETSLPAGYDEDFIEDQPNIRLVKSFLLRYPNVILITGADTYKIYQSEYDKSSTARYQEGVGYFDYFNTALKLDNYKKTEVYHKSKLVPGVEQMPYPSFFKFIEKYTIDLGGITGTLGKQEERTVFFNKDKTGAAPVICYESIFGAFVSEYIRNGAQYIVIVTNDGWWGNTPGHVQHLAYARLRAIETRRAIARAANTGISGFINQKGDILAKNIYGVPDAMVYTLLGNTELTFYSRYGDYMGAIARYISIALLIISVYLFVFNRFIKKVI